MSKPLRVLIIRNAYQQDAGGAEQYALNLALALKKSNQLPILVTNINKIHEKAGRLGVKHIEGPWHRTQKWDRFYYLRYPLFTLWYIFTILRFRVDIVHPQGRDDFIFATRAARILGKPVIWTDHADLKYVLDNINHYNPRMRSWLISASRYASKIVAASHNEKTEISAVAPELKNLEVIHNGVFIPENIRPIDKTNKLVVGTNARLVEAKGIAELLDGFADLKRKDIDLWLIGGVSGNKNKYEKLAVSLGIANQVKIFDYIEHPDDAVAAMDVFVHASYHEAFSLAIIEAAMLGKAIVATNVGGTPEIINETCGVLIEPKSASAITDALKPMLHDDAKRQKLGQAAQKKALAHFDFQKIVDKQIIPLYKELL